MRRFVGLLAVLLASLLIFEILSSLRLKEAYEGESAQVAYRLLDMLDHEQQRIIEDAHHILVTARAFGVGQMDASACRNVMERIAAEFPRHLQLSISDPDGRTWCATDPDEIGRQFYDMGHFRRAMEAGRFTVGHFTLPSVTEAARLPFSLRLEGPGGTPAGLATVSLELGWLAGYLSKRALPPNTSIVIADGEGVILARIPDHQSWVGQKLPERFSVMLEADENGLVEMPGLEGTSRLFAFSPLKSGVLGLMVAIGFDEHSTLYAVRLAALQSFIAFLGLLLISGGAAAWGLRQYLRVRSKAEQALRQTEARLQLALKSARAGAFEWNMKTGEVYWSDEIYRIFAFDPQKQQPSDETWRGSIHPADRDFVNVLFQDIREGKRKTYEAEYRIIVSNHNVRWIFSSGYAQEIGDGEGVHVTGLCMDITERKRIEEALKRSEERLTLVLSSVDAGMWDWDLPTGTVEWSEGLYRLFDLDPETFTPSAEKWFEVLPPEDRGMVQAYVDHTLAMGKPEYRVEHRVRHSDGSIRWLLGIGRIFYDEAGQPFRILGLGIDITEHKELEEALREGEARYRGLVESQRDLVVRINDEGRFTFVNETMCKLLGRDCAELIGAHWTDYVHPDDHEKTREAMERAVTEPEHRTTVECRLRTPSGERWYMWEGTAVFDPDGNYLENQATGRDMTDRHRMEENLRQAKEEAEQANASKSRFLAAASHDLRQPVQSLFLFTTLLEEYVEGEKARSVLAVLRRSLETLKSLLDSLLDISRLEAGVIEVNIEDFSLDMLLQDIEVAYTPLARDKGLDLRVDHPDSPIRVRSDRLLLGRMLRNLIENALRYTESGYVRVSCRQTENGLCLEVEDSGIGIPPEHLSRIFEEFHQVGNEARDRSQGLGLGLAIVKRLSLLLNHPIHVRSDLGKGSVFTIEVPLANGILDADSARTQEAWQDP